MKKFSRAIASLAAAAALVAGLVTVRRASDARTAPRAAALRCDFAGAGELGFRLRVTPDAATGAVGSEGSLLADLRLRPLRDLGGGRWLVAGRLDPRGQGAPHDDLRAPFVVRVGPTCQFEDFAWAPGATARQADAVRAAMRSVEFHLPEARQTLWASTHRDANGTFVAFYRAADTGSATRGARVTAEAGDYVQSARGGAPTHLQGWQLEVELDPQGHLARRVESHARYGFGVGAPLGMRVTLERAELARRDDLPNSAEGFSWRAPSRDEPNGPAQHVAQAPENDPLAAMTVDEAYARLLALFDADHDPAHERAFTHLRAWLRARPGAAMEIWSRLRGGGVDARLHALVMMTLGEANTPEARRALITALRDTGASAMNRQRAAAALGTMHTPTAEALDALRLAAREGGDNDDDVITRGVAMRSVGAMAGDSVPAPVASEARATILQAVESRDAAEHLAGIDAAGNSRSATMIPSIRGALEAEGASERETAAHALRGMPRDAAQPLLSARLSTESAEPVRREVAMTLTENAHGVFSAESVTAAADALPRTADPTVRVELLRLLGEASRSVPAARQALVAWAAREPEASLLAVIGRYVPVAELRDALRLRASR